MTPEIPVAYCFDSKYAPYAAVSTYSLVKSSKSRLKIYWVTPLEYLEVATLLLEHLKELNIEIQIVTPGNESFINWRQSNHITRAAYFRLLLPNLINENKLIYLDCDTLVLNDLEALYKIEMNGCYIGGVEDISSGNSSKVPRVEKDIYINSGVLLMDLEALRSDNFLKKCEVIYETYGELITWHDQCVINKYAEGKKFLLDKKWNQQIYTHNINEDNWSQYINPNCTNIIHFIGGIKPWESWCNKLIADFWWDHANQLSIPGLKPAEITNINQALDIASILDGHQCYKEASGLKSSIIKWLMDLINNPRP